MEPELNRITTDDGAGAAPQQTWCVNRRMSLLLVIRNSVAYNVRALAMCRHSLIRPAKRPLKIVQKMKICN